MFFYRLQLCPGLRLRHFFIVHFQFIVIFVKHKVIFKKRRTEALNEPDKSIMDKSNTCPAAVAWFVKASVFHSVNAAPSANGGSNPA